MFPRIRVWLVFVVIIGLKVGGSRGADDDDSVSTSVAGMVNLLKTEQALVDTLTNYADELQKKVDTIRSGVKEMREELKKSTPNAEAYLSNPINSFSLVRRMHADWRSWKKYLSKAVGEEHIEKIVATIPKLPTTTDIEEGVNAIHRLRVTYNLKVADMAAGLLNGKQYDVRFSALDLYTIGKVLFKQIDAAEANYWIYTALQVFENSEVYAAFNFDEAKIFELYAEALTKTGRFDDAHIVIDKAIVLRPKDSNLLLKKADIEKTRALNVPPIVPSRPPVSVYELGCRGQFPFRSNELHCRYNRTTTDFLKLAPIKIEEISLDPYMVLFHDVLSDAEISHLQELGTGGLKRATVYNETAKRSMAVKTRTSKFSWLNDNTTEITRRINKRIIDMTGFDIVGSEMLQVMNYGLGGHYDTHFDYFNATMDEEVVRLNGNRIATVLFYLSDVEQGGATVFPYINTAVFPQKGTAVMWYNLNNRGEADSRTLHAACPVIVGSKWVCNKWIRERNQFQRRPCPKE